MADRPTPLDAEVGADWPELIWRWLRERPLNLVPREMKVEHPQFPKSMSAEELDSHPLSPARQRRAVDTNKRWKNSSPQKYWKYGVSTQRSQSIFPGGAKHGVSRFAPVCVPTATRLPQSWS